MGKIQPLFGKRFRLQNHPRNFLLLMKPVSVLAKGDDRVSSTLDDSHNEEVSWPHLSVST